MRRRHLLVSVFAVVVFGCGGQDAQSQDAQSEGSVPTTGAGSPVTTAADPITEETELAVVWPSKRIHPTLVYDPPRPAVGHGQRDEPDAATGRPS